MTGAHETSAARQARLLALASVPYAVWIKRQCDRWGIAWREMYGVPMDKPQPKGNTNG